MTQVDLSGYTDRIQVDMTTRKIADAGRAGTQYDHKATRKVFEADRYLNGVDLAEKLASIHWACGMNGGIYPVTEWDTQSVEGKILIRWEILKEYTQSSVLAYAIHFYDLEGEEYGYHAATTITRATFPPTLIMTDHSNKTGDPAAIEQLAKSIVPADWVQNDPDAKDYIKNRPFYENVLLQCEVTSDMNITGMETIKEDGTIVYVRISEDPIPAGTYILDQSMTDGNGEQTERIDIEVEYSDEGVAAIGTSVISVKDDTTTSGTTAKRGVYVFAPALLEEQGISKMTVKLTDLKILNEKFIPDSIMRSENPHGTGTFTMNDCTAKNGGIAAGAGSSASGWSFAIGEKAVASSGGAISVGYNTIVSGGNSQSFGFKTTASGDCSHADGRYTTASGEYSMAHGNYSQAKGRNSSAEGYDTIASGENSHVQGKYNVEDTKNKYAHIVGGGYSDTDRKNIHTLDWRGNAWFNGDVTAKDGKLITQSDAKFANTVTFKLVDEFGKPTDTGTILTGVSLSRIKNDPYACILAVLNGKFDNAYLVLSELTDTYAMYKRYYTDADDVLKYDYIKIVDGDAINNTYGTVTVGAVGTQADWNQTDSTAADFIVNKPFYTDDATAYKRKFDLTSASKTTVTNEIALEEGTTYHVTWDGTAYNCSCQSMYGIKYIGNFSLYTSAPFTKPVTEEPFCVVCPDDTTAEIWGAKGSTHSFAILPVSDYIHQLDPAYIGVPNENQYSDFATATNISGYGKVHYKMDDSNHYTLVLPEMPDVIDKLKKLNSPYRLFGSYHSAVAYDNELAVGGKTDADTVTYGVAGIDITDLTRAFYINVRNATSSRSMIVELTYKNDTATPMDAAHISGLFTDPDTDRLYCINVTFGDTDTVQITRLL